MFEPRQPSGNIGGGASPAQKALLSVEDFNLSKTHTEIVTPYRFDATIFKPLIKNISLSSKPPGPLATAAYAQARGSKSGKQVPPSNSDVSVATKKEKELTEFDKQYTEATKTYSDAITKAKEQGFNEAWSDKVRSSLVKIKKMKVDGKGDSNGAHWLNKAIYPIDLTITIDGIAGFKFGDVISTSLIPKQYTKYDMVFTITKISHSIKDGMWETTLNTKSRISMDG
jgi:hypothetical protein